MPGLAHHSDDFSRAFTLGVILNPVFGAVGLVSIDKLLPPAGRRLHGRFAIGHCTPQSEPDPQPEHNCA